jgi:glutathione S-transferase
MTEPAKSSGAEPRLYHAPSSYYSMIARLALAEGGIAHEPVFVDIHFRMSQQQPDYVRLNPNMTVPTLGVAGPSSIRAATSPNMRWESARRRSTARPKPGSTCITPIRSRS